MDSNVNAISAASDELVAALKEAMDARQLPDSDRVAAVAAAVAKVRQARESFALACDQADDLVQHAKERLAGDSFSDMATGSFASSSSRPGPIEVAGLERARRAIKLLEEQAMEHGALLAVAGEEDVATDEANPLDTAESEGDQRGGADLQFAENIEIGGGGGLPAGYWEIHGDDDLFGEEAAAAAVAEEEDDELLGKEEAAKDDAAAPKVDDAAAPNDEAAAP